VFTRLLAEKHPSTAVFCASTLFSLVAGDLARIKQTAHRRRWYVMLLSSSSSSSTATASSNTPSLEKTISDPVATVELQPGHTIEFGTSRIYSGHVHEMQRLGYFGNGVRRAPRAEAVSEPKGELVVFEAFFTAGFRLHTH
jgi:class 3 adenylate cyclase